jgi:hypothetical protein
MGGVVMTPPEITEGETFLQFHDYPDASDLRSE